MWGTVFRCECAQTDKFSNYPDKSVLEITKPLRDFYTLNTFTCPWNQREVAALEQRDTTASQKAEMCKILTRVSNEGPFITSLSWGLNEMSAVFLINTDIVIKI